ncbi:MAG: DUF1707 and DUF2154 domain-containing protein [Spirochaetales bacterium]|nr:DUF1707 and DUF2154 domain-containing protein [Spirochaetales bacterium]
MSESAEGRAPRRAPGPVPATLGFRRERAIAILSEGFARDLIRLEEFERRVAKAHAAATLEELDRLLDDIPEELHSISARPERAPLEARGRTRELSAEPQEVRGVMMSRTLRGDWLTSRVVAVRAVMSSIELDFREVALPPGEVELRMACVMSTVVVTVPEGLPVQVDVSPVLGEVKESRRRTRLASLRGRSAPAPRPGSSLRITGTAVMSEVRVRAR